MNMEKSWPSTPKESVGRIAARYVFDARIRIRVQRAQQDLEMEGWVRDLSESGLGAFVARELMVGELVLLELPLSPSNEITIPAKVARSLGTQYGFQFTALSGEQRAAIRSAVQSRATIDSSRTE
jgi:hypothetical protein